MSGAGRPGGAALGAAVQAVSGRRPARVVPLAGGCIAEVVKVELQGGGALVAKTASATDTGGGLAVEAYMLDYLRRHSALPVPAVLHAAPGLLLIEYVETSGGLTRGAEAHAADLLADLHGITAPRFGLERDTLIGSLRQPNPWTQSWRAFFRDRRLRYMGRVAHECGRLPAETLARLEAFCGRLDAYIDEPPAASLIHGDVWAGNVLTRDGRIAGFVDPAIYYADPEIELAFSTLFSTFGDAFFARYREHRPIAPGFFEARRDIYNLYPLLVHTALFGGHYADAVERTLRRFTLVEKRSPGTGGQGSR